LHIVCAKSGRETKPYERMLRFDRQRLLYTRRGNEDGEME